MNWTLSISKGNGEDPDPFFSYDSNAKSYFDLIQKKKKTSNFEMVREISSFFFN